jgi:hypothetical protein
MEYFLLRFPMNISPKLEKKRIFLIFLCILAAGSVIFLLYGMFFQYGPYGGISISEMTINEIQGKELIHLNEQDFHKFPALDSLIRQHRPGYVDLDQDQYDAYGRQFGGKILEYEGKYYDLHFTLV